MNFKGKTLSINKSSSNIEEIVYRNKKFLENAKSLSFNYVPNNK